MTQIICVTGPDGSGKTTQITKLAEALAGRGTNVAAVTIWDLLLDPSVRGKVLFAEPQDVDRYLAVLSSTARAHFLYHCFHEAMALGSRRQADVLLVNSYWYKYFATEVAHGGDRELLRRLAAGFAPPDRTFYLRVDPTVAYQRKDQLSGYETGFAEPRSEEAFLAFQRTSLGVLDDLARELEWIELDGRKKPEELTATLVAHVVEGG